MTTKYYVVITTTIDKSGMVSLERFGYTTSSALRDRFIKTCALATDKLNGKIYTIEFISLREMCAYMQKHYDNYMISGDDRIVTIPVKGTLSPYYDQCIVTTLDDVFNSDAVGFIRDAETLLIRGEIRRLNKVLTMFNKIYFNDEFESYTRIITEVTSYIIRVLNSITDDAGHTVIDTENWDVPQYGILKGRYEV